MITKEEFKKALEERRIVVIGVHFNPNKRSFGYGWNGFRVFEIKVPEGEMGEIIGQHLEKTVNSLWEEKTVFSLWDKKKGYYSVNSMGTDRTLQVILNIGYGLGLEFQEIKQNYNVICGGF